MITLSKCDYEMILNHCLGQLPNEACGLLAGRVTGNKKTVAKIYLLSNIDQSPEHFSMEPKEQFGAVKDMRAKGRG